MTEKITVTGASGFVGRALCMALSNKGLNVLGTLRSPKLSESELIAGVEYVLVGDVGAQTDWATTLSGVGCVIHTAARAHLFDANNVDALATYRAINVEGTRRLAEQAEAYGVKRLVYLSSIKVNGERTFKGVGFTATDFAKPEDPYGISKWEAEQVLLEVAARNRLEVVIIRPPLVYGPGVKGNFYTILKWLSCGIPLPLGAIYNRRSLVGIDNLVDLIITCINHPAAANQTFLVSDGEDISTTDLLRRLARSFQKPAYLLRVPSAVLELTARLVGKKAIAQRLLGNLHVDISKTREILDWTPPVCVDEALTQTAEWYLSQR